MAGRSGPPTTSPAASDNSEKGTNTKAGPPVTAISDVFPGVWAMRYLLTGQLDRLARLDEILFPHQISNVALTDPKQAPLFSTTEHIKEEKHGSGNSKLELSPSPNEEVKDDVHGKTLDNPVGIALRALLLTKPCYDFPQRHISSIQASVSAPMAPPSQYSFRVDQIKRLVSIAKNMDPHYTERFRDLLDAKMLTLDDSSKYVDDDQLVDDLVGLSELKDSLDAAVLWSKNIDALIKEKLRQLLTKHNILRQYF
ncbi:MAG: hypothetical protein LQ346_003097 [Caloplaca aetnensis]|nr:MAG: hypothetical protein LQ346_003097 [Caloplaca aetnensis]